MFRHLLLLALCFSSASAKKGKKLKDCIATAEFVGKGKAKLTCAKIKAKGSKGAALKKQCKTQSKDFKKKGKFKGKTAKDSCPKCGGCKAVEMSCPTSCTECPPRKGKCKIKECYEECWTEQTALTAAAMCDDDGRDDPTDAPTDFSTDFSTDLPTDFSTDMNTDSGGGGGGGGTAPCDGDDMDNDSIKAATKMWLGGKNAKKNAKKKYGDIKTWCTGKVTEMSNLFYGASSFNDDIGNWDTSAVTDMEDMFNQAEAFNQDIGNWDVAKVFRMSDMFAGARAFNKPIGDWQCQRIGAHAGTYEAT